MPSAVQIKRIGKYKSAGDQLLRSDMSEAQQEQLDALLDGLYGSFLSGVAAVRSPAASIVCGSVDRAHVQHAPCCCHPPPSPPKPSTLPLPLDKWCMSVNNETVRA